MNWGYKITLVIVTFILAMLTMVFVAFKQTNDMIDTNYYEKELKYQDLIDAASKLNSFYKDPIVIQNEKTVNVQIPKELISGFENGKLEFIRNDDKKKDILLNFSPDAKGLFFIKKSKFIAGVYKARIRWESQHETYYREQDLIVEK